MPWIANPSSDSLDIGTVLGHRRQRQPLSTSTRPNAVDCLAHEDKLGQVGFDPGQVLDIARKVTPY